MHCIYKTEKVLVQQFSGFEWYVQKIIFESYRFLIIQKICINVQINCSSNDSFYNYANFQNTVLGRFPIKTHDTHNITLVELSLLRLVWLLWEESDQAHWIIWTFWIISWPMNPGLVKSFKKKTGIWLRLWIWISSSKN